MWALDALVHDAVEGAEVGLDDAARVDGLHDDGAHLRVARVVEGREDVPPEERGDVRRKGLAALHERGVVEHLAQRLRARQHDRVVAQHVRVRNRPVQLCARGRAASATTAQEEEEDEGMSAYPNMALGELEGIAVVVDGLAHVRDPPRPFDERRETREEQAM